MVVLRTNMIQGASESADVFGRVYSFPLLKFKLDWAITSLVSSSAALPKAHLRAVVIFATVAFCLVGSDRMNPLAFPAQCDREAQVNCFFILVSSVSIFKAGERKMNFANEVNILNGFPLKDVNAWLPD